MVKGKVNQEKINSTLEIINILKEIEQCKTILYNFDSPGIHHIATIKIANIEYEISESSVFTVKMLIEERLIELKDRFLVIIKNTDWDAYINDLVNLK